MTAPAHELNPHTPEQASERSAEVRFEQLDSATVERLRVLSELPIADLQASGDVRQEVIGRLLEGMDPDTVASIEERLTRDLETARSLQQQFLETLRALQTAEAPAANEPMVTAKPTPVVIEPPKPIDGVTPPITAGDEEPEEETKVTETTVVAAKTVEAIHDPFAERNIAAQGLLDQLTLDDYSVPGRSNLDLLKQVREVILRHQNEPLAVRYDTDGNVVIGSPEDGGDGLRTRLITISHQEAGTVEWLQRARPKEYLTLQQHRISVIEDPQLQHDPQSEALAA